MKNLIFFYFVLVIISSSANAAPPQQYSAQQTITSAGTAMVSSIFADGGKMRVDSDMNGMKMTMIIRPDKNATYQLMPGNLYMELPLGAMPTTPSDFMNANAAQQQDVGTETVDGISCKKQKVTVNGQSMFMWVQEETEIPVKVASEDGAFQIAWKNVVVGPQKAELFEVPAGYIKADMGAMMDPNMMQSLMQSMQSSMGQGGTLPQMPAGIPGIPATPPEPQTPSQPLTP